MNARASAILRVLWSTGAPVSHVVAFAVLAVAWQSFFWNPALALSIKIAFFGLTALAAWRPIDGLLAAAALCILGNPLAALLGATPDTGAEAIAISFLVGWMGRSIWRREALIDVTDRLQLVALAFAATAVVSLVVTTAIEQVRWGPAQAYFAVLARAFWREYLVQLHTDLHHVHAALLILECALLVPAVLQLSRTSTGLAMRVIRIIVLATAAAGTLSCVRLAMGLLRSTDPAHLLISTFTGLRLTFHVSDVNAAGSHFAMVLPIVAGMIFVRRRSWPWILSLVPLLPALWLTGSRTAFLAVALVFAAGAFNRTWRKPLVVLAPIAIVAIVAAFVLWPTTQPLSRWTWLQSGASRVSFLKMSWNMWQQAPVFGLGIGEFLPTSALYMPPDLRLAFPMENAHNNYAQIGVELGLVGLVAFLGVVGIVLRRIWSVVRDETADTVLLGTGLGLVAFLITCLTGHPLLVEPVAYAFWLTLAAGAAWAGRIRAGTGEFAVESSTAAANRTPFPPHVLLAGFVAAMVLLLPPRTAFALRSLDLTNVRYGFSAREIDQTTGDMFRWAGPSATMFVPRSVQAVSMALSAGSGAGPLEVSFSIDGRLANKVLVPDAQWTDMSLLMPWTTPAAQFRRFEIVVRRAGDAATGRGQVDQRDSVTRADPKVRIRNLSFYPPPLAQGPGEPRRR